jgi:tetratricopeptide (TPR) repeat protein
MTDQEHQRVLWLRDSGELEAAILALRQALSGNPRDARALYTLAVTKRFERYDQDVAAVESLLAGSDLSDPERMRLELARGKILDELGRHDEAFAAIARGNAMMRRSFSYDVKDALATMLQLSRTFDAAQLARGAGLGCHDRTPIFIVGMPRSGTSLVEQILASHSRVHGAGELSTFADVCSNVSQTEDGELVELRHGVWGPADLHGLGAAYVARIRELMPDAVHITDKMPGNFMNLGLIHSTLPSAKIVHVRRNPLDNCWSLFKILFETGQRYSYDLEELALYYLGYRALMRHWQRALPGRILELDYEDLVADQSGETERLLGFCGLELEAGCLDFHRTKRVVRTASAAQVRQPMFASSVGAWKHYRAQLSPLIAILEPYA